MDFCSIKQGIKNKVKEIAQKDNIFRISEDLAIPSKEATPEEIADRVKEINDSFGGTVMSKIDDNYIIDPIDRIANAYLLNTKQNLIDKANDLIYDLKEPLSTAFAIDPSQALLEIAIQSNTGNMDQMIDLVGHELVSLADRIFPDAKLGETMADYTFESEPKLKPNDDSFYNYKERKNFEGLQDAVLYRMNNMTGDARDRNIVSKINNKYYITSTRKGEISSSISSTNYNLRRFNDFLAFNSIPSNLFSVERTKTADGKDILVVKKTSEIKNDIIEGSKKTDKINSIISFLSERFGYKDNVKVLTRKEFKAQYPNEYNDNINAVVLPNKDIVLLVDSNSNHITAEELLHPFINALNHVNPSLFSSLLAQAKRDFPNLVESVKINYVKQNKVIQNQEIVAKALARVFAKEQEENDPKTLKELIGSFVTWLKDTFKELLAYYNNDGHNNVDIDSLSSDTSLETLARLINTSDSRFDVQFGPTFFNQSTKTEDIYQEIYNSLTDPSLEATIGNIITRLPDTVKSIKNSLDYTTDKKSRSELTDLLNDIHKVTTNESMVKTQFRTVATIINLLHNINNKVRIINRSQTNPNLKIIQLNSLYKIVKSVEPFQELTTELLSSIEAIKGRTPQLKEFYNMLYEAIGTPQKIESEISSLLKNPIVDLLTDYNMPFYKETLERINAEKAKLKTQAEDSNLPLEKRERASKQISKLNQDIAKLPTRDTFEKIFSSQFKDANSISIMLESGIANGHPLVSSLVSIIEDVYQKAHKDILRSRNEFQQQIEDLTKSVGKGLRDQEDLYKKITTTVKRPTSVKEKDGEPVLENGKPVFEYKEQRALINSYAPEYIQLKEEKDVYSDYLFGKMINARNNLNKAKNRGSQLEIDKYQAEDEKYTEMLREANQDAFNFNKENSEDRYTENIYNMYELLDMPVGKDAEGNDITIRQLKGDIYTKIDNAQDALRKEMIDPASRQQIVEEIALLSTQLKELKNPFNKDGTPKTGVDSRIVEVLEQYNKLRIENGEYTLTPESQSEFENDKMILEDDYKKGVIDEAEYNRRKSLMMRDEFDSAYFDAMNDAYEMIGDIMTEVLNVPELAKNYNKDDKDKIRDAYKKIRDISRAYRDQNGVIDGDLMSKGAPDLVKTVKELQEAVEDIKSKTQKLSSLSIDKSMELKDLGNKIYQEKNATPEEKARYNELKLEKSEITKQSKLHKDLLDRLNSALKFIGKITQGSTTHYYEEAKQEAIDKLKNSQEIQTNVENIMRSGDFRFDSHRFFKDSTGKWWEEIFDENAKALVQYEAFNKNDPTDTGDHVVRNILLNGYAKQQLELSDWYKDNHYNKLQWDEVSKSYVPTSVPIYIWEMQTPTNQNYILKDQPSSMYKTYKIHEKNENPNYKLISGNIAAPKAGKFDNAEYEALKNSKDPSDKGYMKYLNFARDKYAKAQEYYPEGRKMGDILPAIVKTKGENLVNMTNNVLDGHVGEIFAATAHQTDNDTAYLLGGSQKATNKVPMRFTGKMDKDTQSANVSAMLLSFELAGAQYNRMNDQLPVIETVKNLASKLGVLEAKNISNKLNFVQSMKSMFNRTGTSIDVEKEAGDSILSKTIDNFVDMLVYGRKTKESTINAMGKVWDINKIAGGAMGFAAKSIFIGNIFAAVKNSVATRVQVMIQSNIKQNVYSQLNFAKANGQMASYMPDLMRDFTKVGNKSLIGQVLDYFSVMPQSVFGQLTEKTEFTLLKEKMTLLSSPKDMSEFEVMVTQFLTFANNKIVKVNGQDVPLGNIEEIFEKDKTGTLKFKDGVVFTDQDEASFIKLFRKYTREIGGAYRETEQTQLETHWVGKLVMYMRKYLVPGIAIRYAGRRYSIEEGDITEGYYRSTFKNVLNLFTDYKGNVLEKWNDMSDMEKSHTIKLMKEMVFIFGLLLLTHLMGSGDKKKELENNTYSYNFLLSELMAVQTETETFNFPMFAGTDDIIRIIKNPLVASQQIGNVYKIIPLLAQTIAGSESAYYQRKSGTHNAGDSKLLAQFLKVVGYTGRLWDGPEMVKTQQQLKTLR